MCEGPVTISSHINGEVNKIPLKGETSTSNNAFQSLAKRRNSWGDLEFDLDDDNEEKPLDGSNEPDQIQESRNNDRIALTRRFSWDDLDLSEHLKRHGDSVSENPTKNIVLVGRVDDTEKFLTSPGANGSENTKKKKAVKSLSNRLGLMSPFKGKNKLQSRNNQEPAVPEM